MRMPTYTHLYRLERRLYAVGDLRLPFSAGIGLAQAAVAVMVGLCWSALLSALRVPFTAAIWVVWVAPPVAAAWLWGRQVVQHRTPAEFVAAHLRGWAGPREFRGGRAMRRGAGCGGPTRVCAVVWTPR